MLTAAPAYKCPAAPYEAAMLIDADFRRRGVRAAVELALYSAEPGPMGVAGPEASAAVRGMVEGKGIVYRPAHQVARVQGRRVLFTNGAAPTSICSPTCHPSGRRGSSPTRVSSTRAAGCGSIGTPWRRRSPAYMRSGT